jgi:hypothetical protein
MSPALTETPPAAARTTRDPDWLLAPDAARILGVNRKSLCGLAARGLIRRREIPGAHPRYSRTDCEELARRTTVGTGDEQRQ